MSEVSRGLIDLYIAKLFANDAYQTSLMKRALIRAANKRIKLMEKPCSIMRPLKARNLQLIEAKIGRAQVMPFSEGLSGIFVFRCYKRCRGLFTCGTMFDDALHFLVDGQERPDWQRLGQHLPYEWIEQALAYTGKASVRHCRLPAEQVVWLVVALALYRHQSISEVVDDLDPALPDLQTPFVSKSDVAQARQRLGSEPLPRTHK